LALNKIKIVKSRKSKQLLYAKDHFTTSNSQKLTKITKYNTKTPSEVPTELPSQLPTITPSEVPTYAYEYIFNDYTSSYYNYSLNLRSIFYVDNIFQDWNQNSVVITTSWENTTSQYEIFEESSYGSIDITSYEQSYFAANAYRYGETTGLRRQRYLMQNQGDL